MGVGWKGLILLKAPHAMPLLARMKSRAQQDESREGKRAKGNDSALSLSSLSNRIH